MRWSGAEGARWRGLAARLAGKGVDIVARTPLWPYYLALAHSYLPVSLWRGVTNPHGRQGSVLVVGKEPWVCHLPERIFSGTVHRERIGRYPIWALPGRLKRLQRSVDLTIVRASPLNARLFPETDYLHAPEWIGTWLPLPEDPKTPFRFSKNLRGGDIRVIRRSRLKAIVSQKESDLNEFYRHMYIPFVRNRFGVQGLPYSRRAMLSRFLRGGILWVHRDGERLSGALLERNGKRVMLRALGTADGDLGLVRQGVLAAVYHFSIEAARQWGCTEIGLGMSRALLQDGVLRYKHKWGGSLEKGRHSNFEVLMGWNRIQGVAGDFLSHTSPVFCEPGGYAAVHALDTGRPAGTEDALLARKSLWIRGLNRLYLLGPAGWEPGVTVPPDTVLIDGLNHVGVRFLQGRESEA